MMCLFQISEAVEDSYIHHAMGDMLYHIEHEGQLPEFWLLADSVVVTDMAAQQACYIHYYSVFLEKTGYLVHWWSTRAIANCCDTSKRSAFIWCIYNCW